MNHTMIAGHLGADPEVRFTSSGQKVTTLRVAARCRRGAKDETIWWRVTIWGEQFDKMIPYLKKGSPIVVMGEMNKPEIFTDRDGKPQVSMSLTAFSISFSPFGRPDGGSEGRESSHESSHGSAPEPTNLATQGQAQGQARGVPAFSDDEVPF
ncbi:MAG: single-stranded DNA-binding protein [Rhabdochlamydiaceae bacterium]|jgi:single-strand DNA-binding protein|nr:single-stranded DNA-binding protein [Rhabdochlamydiaceae bacterium]